MIKLLKVIGVICANALFSIGFGVLAGRQWWIFPCTSDCTGLSWLRYFTGYWFTPLAQASGYDAYALDLFEFIINVFVLLTLFWLLLIFRRERVHCKK